MAKIISLFNHKGGVSKTTTVFNLGWILAEKGNKVLIVDADPQCNLTGVCLSLSDNSEFEDFYLNDKYDNLKKSLTPVFDGQPIPLEPAKCFEFYNKKGLFLLPGHIDFSEFDVSIGIAQELTGSMKIAQNIPGAISQLLRITADKYKFDYILIDMSPSVSATNANLFIQSDYFIVPCSPDYFCNMAISSLSKVIPMWYETYRNIKLHPAFKNAIYKLPDKNPKFLGTILQRYRPRNGGAARSFQQWIDRINANVEGNLVPILTKYNMIIDKNKFKNVSIPEEPYNIINISDFNSLIAQSQKNNVPVFALTDAQIEQSGNVLEKMKNSREEFHQVFSRLADIVIQLTI
ncbi:ParA family protein [Hathewaya proteolytica]|nr:ParA family protein [Hathewaya proteolytica]